MSVPRRLAFALWLGCGSALALLGAFPRSAAACSCAVTTSLVEPAPGTTDVSLDRALLIEGDFTPDEVELETEDGDPVDFAFRHEYGPASCSG